MAKRNLRNEVLNAVRTLCGEPDAHGDLHGRASAATIAELVGCTPATARRHAMALAEAGELRAHKRRRWVAQSTATNYGIEGASMLRRDLSFTTPTERNPAGVFGNY